MAPKNGETRPLISPADNAAAEPKQFDRASLKARWIILLLCSIALTGNYYCYDNPSALKGQLQDYFEGTKYSGDGWETWFALLYSVYSFPNTVLPFVGGFLVDRIGVRPMTIAFCTFITIGQVIFALGTNLKSIPVMLVGRVIFGFGGESLTVASSAILARWFKDKELALALGINLGVSRLGGVANNYVSPVLWKQAEFSIWFGAILCGVSLFAAGLMVMMDKVAEVKLKKLNTDYDKTKVEDEIEQVRITDVRHFGLPFWLLTTICLVIYGTVLPFNNVASTFLQERDFLTKDLPWYGNRTYIAPTCKGPKPESAGLVISRDCGVNNTYLGPLYIGANFSGVVSNANGTSFGARNYTIPCADGYEYIDNIPIVAQCMATTSSDQWIGVTEFGARYWEVMNDAVGCARKDSAPKVCEGNIDDWVKYLGAEKVAANQYVCSKKFCKRDNNVDGCVIGANELDIDIDCGEYGVPEYTGNATCVPQLYDAQAYCSAVDNAQTKANTIMSIPYEISIVISPLLGYGVDRLGKRALLATMASFALIAVHSVLGLTSIAPYAPLAGQGLAYSVFAAALWPSVPYAVEEQYCGTAYGVMTAVQNTGLATFPLAVSALLATCAQDPVTEASDILDEATYSHCLSTMDNYKHSELFFVGLAVLGSIVGIWLYVDDIVNRNGRLNKAHINTVSISDEDLKRAEQSSDPINA